MRIQRTDNKSSFKANIVVTSRKSIMGETALKFARENNLVKTPACPINLKNNKWLIPDKNTTAGKLLASIDDYYRSLEYNLNARESAEDFYKKAITTLANDPKTKQVQYSTKQNLPL